MRKEQRRIREPFTRTCSCGVGTNNQPATSRLIYTHQLSNASPYETTSTNKRRATCLEAAHARYQFRSSTTGSQHHAADLASSAPSKRTMLLIQRTGPMSAGTAHFGVARDALPPVASFLALSKEKNCVVRVCSRSQLGLSVSATQRTAMTT